MVERKEDLDRTVVVQAQDRSEEGCCSWKTVQMIAVVSVARLGIELAGDVDRRSPAGGTVSEKMHRPAVYWTASSFRRLSLDLRPHCFQWMSLQDHGLLYYL